MKLKYFSHAAFQITSNDGKRILIDPFLDDNPTSPVKSDEVDADYIILTHAHSDHLGDAFKIAKRCNSKFICTFELANYCKSKGFDAHDMSIGGGHEFDFGKVKFTIAHHGSQTPEGNYAGEPAGVLVTVDDSCIYHAGDTGLFYDMKLIGEMNNIDYMLVPIGDNYTMGISDAVKAVELVHPKIAVPMHYNTFPIIEVNLEDFKCQMEEKGMNCCIMNFGEEIQV